MKFSTERRTERRQVFCFFVLSVIALIVLRLALNLIPDPPPCPPYDHSAFCQIVNPQH